MAQHPSGRILGLAKRKSMRNQRIEVPPTFLEGDTLLLPTKAKQEGCQQQTQTCDGRSLLNLPGDYIIITLYVYIYIYLNICIHINEL